MGNIILITTGKKALQQADVIRSIRQLKDVMKDWQDTVKNNSTDGEDYSRGLLKGYETAMRQVDNWLG